jgi:hypothetical protein
VADESKGDDSLPIIHMRVMSREESAQYQQDQEVSLARFGRGDYTSMSTLIREIVDGLDRHEICYAEKLSVIDFLVERLCSLYRNDSRLFDENRFRSDATGHVEK